MKTKNSTVFQESGTKVANLKRKEFLTAKSLEQIIIIKLHLKHCLKYYMILVYKVIMNSVKFNSVCRMEVGIF